MGQDEFSALGARTWDVTICGGGLAGLLLARQLRQAFPARSVAVIERTPRPLPTACHKVGESSVELGSQYFERLGLADYLLEHHIVKFGLRFFPGGGDLPIEARTELGPANEPVVRSYQTDRGRLETDLREMIIGDGAHLVEGASVRDVNLSKDGGIHELVAARGDERVTVRSRWVIDATGRAGLLRGRLKLKRGTRHPAHSGWFRVKGRVDITKMAPAEATEWHGRPYADQRWRSTNHFMGDGYWAWVIPLSSGHTSVGVVVHEERFDFDAVRSLERTRGFLAEHEPALAAHIDGAEVLDFMCLKGYSHNAARCWSADRWALVGEAGAFVDPLYSPGTDFIAFANSFTTELIRRDLDGEDLIVKARELNLQYRALVAGAVDVFRSAAPVFAHPTAMATKIYWDNLAYWSFPCQYFQQRLYELTGEAHTAFSGVGQRFVELSNHVQALLKEWVRVAPERPTAKMVGLPAFPSLLVDAHLALQKTMTPAETLAYMRQREREGTEIVGEIALRIVQSLAPEAAADVLNASGYYRWNLPISAERLDIEPLVGLKRRRALSSVARDIERCLGGRVQPHERAAESRRLLLARSDA